MRHNHISLTKSTYHINTMVYEYDNHQVPQYHHLNHSWYYHASSIRVWQVDSLHRCIDIHHSRYSGRRRILKRLCLKSEVSQINHFSQIWDFISQTALSCQTLKPFPWSEQLRFSQSHTTGISTKPWNASSVPNLVRCLTTF